MPAWTANVLLLWCVAGLPSAVVGTFGVGTARLVPRIPPRTSDAPTGSQFARGLHDVTPSEGQRRAVSELVRGNMPDFLRRLLPVRLAAHGPGGRPVEATIFVLPDYLAIGSDDDFLYVPLGYGPATAVARNLGFVLPTPKMVDAIYAQSVHQLAPHPLPAGPLMRSTAYLQEHQVYIDAQRRGLPLGCLISGHKKDLVITERLLRQPGRVAIYGWHRRTGAPIQPLSTVHGAAYADYSHGVRLVSETVLVGGRPRSIYEVLADPALAPALTYEHVLPDARRLMGL